MISDELLVCYWRALEKGTPEEQLALARRVLNSQDIPRDGSAFSTAACIALKEGFVEEVRLLIEDTLFCSFDTTYKTLLPLLAHIYQRQFDFLNAHILYSICARLGLFEQADWLSVEDAIVACGLAEHVYYTGKKNEAPQSAVVRARALYELALTVNSSTHRCSSSVRNLRVPDFLIIGSAKCGTTFLYDLISRSPEVWNRQPKEIHYFTNYYNFGSDFYSRFFLPCPQELICGEASPDYFDACNPSLDRYVDTAHRIVKLAPNVKIIIILRDPAYRAISLYNQLSTNDHSNGPRPGNMKLDDISINEIFDYDQGYILESGKYIVPLQRFRDLFSEGQLLVLNFSELMNVKPLSERVWKFLGVKKGLLDASSGLAVNAGGHNTISSSVYHDLRSYYSESLQKLQDEFGISL